MTYSFLYRVEYEDSQDVLDLAILSMERPFPYDIYPLLKKLAEKTPQKETQESKDKIMYVLLRWIYNNMDNFPDPLLAVEFIYEDFDNPSSIETFVRRLPMTGKDMGSVDKNIARLHKYWAQYLEAQERVWTQ